MAHAAVRDITAPGDPIVSFGGSTPANQTVDKVIDNTTQKHLNHGVGPNPNQPPFVGAAGFVVTPAIGATILQGFRVYPADDVEARDPVNYTLTGSRNGGPFITLSSGTLALPSARNAAGSPIDSIAQPYAEVFFENTEAYTSYRFAVNTVKNPATANSYQIAEIEIMGITPDEVIVVTTTADEDNGSINPALGTGTSLREAINQANTINGDVTIVFSSTVFAAPRKTITLNGTQLTVLQPGNTLTTGTLSIMAPAAGVEISGNNASRILQNQRLLVHLKGLTFRNGRVTGGAGVGWGGAIYVPSAQPFIVESCTFHDNLADWRGGAIYGRNLDLRNCTFFNNVAGDHGGAVYGTNAGDVDSCTMTQNQASLGGGFGGGPANFRNCIIAGNTATDNLASDFGGLVQCQSLGYNLIGLTRLSIFVQAGDQVIGSDSPGLLAAADNGGPARTCALGSGSPARDTGSSAIAVDQRGVSRPQGLVDDKGACESNATSESLVVTTLADEDNGTSDPAVGTGTSLREAINFANAYGGNNTITFSRNVFAAPRRTITLGGTGLPAITSTLTITAPAAGVEISGNNVSSVFLINGGANVTLTGLTIRNGNSSGPSGVWVIDATALLDSCTLTGNTANQAGAAGLSSSNGSHTMTLRNCTLSGNASSGGLGGGLRNISGQMTLDSCTITNNSGGGALSGDTNGAHTTVRNSILSANSGGDVIHSGTNTFQSNGYNLIGSGNGASAFNQTNDVTGNTNPGLLPLADNGGKTQTHAITLGSPARNTGSTSLTVDQRGFPRSLGGTLRDKGAYEFPAPIESLVVTTTADEDDSTSDPAYGTGTSLREALKYAAFNAAAITFDATAFAAPRKTITLSQPIVIPGTAGQVSITAPAAGVEISGNNSVRVFDNLTDTTLTGLTIRNGYHDTGGGGLRTRNGVLTLTNCTFTGNSGGNGNGGAISKDQQDDGYVGADGCTFSGNSAANGGAIYIAGPQNRSAMRLRNCTLTGNTATGRGGAFYASVGRGSIENCTITGNNAAANQGGGLCAPYDNITTISLQNSIVAGNSDGDIDGTDFTLGDSVPFPSQGHNLFGTGTGFNVDSTDIVIGNAPPGLGSLQPNGGPTFTMALLGGSPAIDAGAATLSVDQRGVSRPQGSADDIGAYELIPLTIVTASFADGTAGQPYPATNVVASGGIAPYSFSILSGYLPPGLTLSSGGVLSGTPQSAGAYSFTILGTDATSNSGQRSYSMSIRGVSAPLAGATAEWYRAEGNADSFSGGSGTLINNVTYAAGHTGQAFSFNGVGIVALPDNIFPYPTTGQTGSVPFSFECWFKTTTGGGILGQQGSNMTGTANYVPALYIGSNGQLRGSLFSPGFVGNLPAVPGIVTDGRWHHVAFTYGEITQDGPMMRLYLDGQLTQELATLQYGYAASYAYQLGAAYTRNWPFGGTGYSYFNGLIDEAAIYRRALTAAEVQSLFAAGTKGKSTVASLASIVRNNANSYTLGLKGWPGLNFQLQRSQTLVPSAFTDVSTPLTTDPNGQASFLSIPPAGGPSAPTGFFRAYEVPSP